MEERVSVTLTAVGEGESPVQVARLLALVWEELTPGEALRRMQRLPLSLGTDLSRETADVLTRHLEARGGTVLVEVVAGGDLVSPDDPTVEMSHPGRRLALGPEPLRPVPPAPAPPRVASMAVPAAPAAASVTASAAASAPAPAPAPNLAAGPVPAAAPLEAPPWEKDKTPAPPWEDSPTEKGEPAKRGLFRGLFKR